MEWNKLQRGDIIRHTKTGTFIRRKATDRTVLNIRDGRNGGRYVTISSGLTKIGSIEYPTGAAKFFHLVRTSIDTTKREMKRIGETISVPQTPVKMTTKTKDKTILVRFSVSGVTEKPIQAEFTINQ